MNILSQRGIKLICSTGETLYFTLILMQLSNFRWIFLDVVNVQLPCDFLCVSFQFWIMISTVLHYAFFPFFLSFSPVLWISLIQLRLLLPLEAFFIVRRDCLWLLGLGWERNVVNPEVVLPSLCLVAKPAKTQAAEWQVKKLGLSFSWACDNILCVFVP